MRFCILLWLITIAMGCGSAHDPPKAKGHSDEHGDHAGHEDRGKHTGMEMPNATKQKLTVRTDPEKPATGAPTKLSLEIPDEHGKPVKSFELLHEKLVHLIMVREGLDEFAHVHPEVTDSGSIETEYVFLKSGKYALFADYQPKGASPGLAVGSIVVAGDDAPSEALEPNSSNEVTIEGIKAFIDVTSTEMETTLRYRLVNASGEAIIDLQPYLGAMGHLVIISSDSTEYVHAHPVSEAKTAPDGVVDFAAHFAKPGIYKAWGQFKRNDEIITVPFVLEHKMSHGEAHGGHGDHSK